MVQRKEHMPDGGKANKKDGKKNREENAEVRGKHAKCSLPKSSYKRHETAVLSSAWPRMLASEWTQTHTHTAVSLCLN